MVGMSLIRFMLIIEAATATAPRSIDRPARRLKSGRLPARRGFDLAPATWLQPQFVLTSCVQEESSIARVPRRVANEKRMSAKQHHVLGAARASSAQGLPTFRLKAKLGSVVAVKCLIYLIGAPRLNFLASVY